MRSLNSKLHRSHSRGDTIVEVLVCIAVLGTVLGMGYAVARRNTLINLSSQERLVAIKLAQNQLEMLRASALSVAVLDTNFCFNTAGVWQNATITGQCDLNSVGALTTEEPIYKTTITQSAVLHAPEGAEYKVAVSWSDVRGGTNNVNYSYRIYR